LNNINRNSQKRIPHRRIFIPDAFGDVADKLMVEDF